MALDVFHLGAVAVWFGGLAVLAALLTPSLRPEDRPDDVRRVSSKFSTYAFGAVIVVVATGVVQSLRQVGSFYALFNTVYGVTLLVKIGFVVVLIALGAVSRRIVLGAWSIPLMGSSSTRHLIRLRSSLGFASPTRASGIGARATEQRPVDGSGIKTHAADARRRRPNRTTWGREPGALGVLCWPRSLLLLPSWQSPPCL